MLRTPYGPSRGSGVAPSTPKSHRLSSSQTSVGSASASTADGEHDGSTGTSTPARRSVGTATLPTFLPVSGVSPVASPPSPSAAARAPRSSERTPSLHRDHSGSLSIGKRGSATNLASLYGRTVAARLQQQQLQTPQSQQQQQNSSLNDSFSSTASSTLARRQQQQQQRIIEVSYSSTLLFLWATLLAVVSYRNNYPLQAASILTLCSVALTSEHGESRLLWPLVFLSERCLDHAQNLRHSPIEYYSSTLLSYLTLVACRAERTGKSARDRNVVLETVLYAIVGLFVVFFVVQDNIICFAAVAFVGTGYIFFLKLLPHLGDNEAVLVSTLVGFYIGDLCVNNNLSIDGGRETILSFSAPGYVTSYTHIASRGMVLGSIYLMVTISVLSRFCLVSANRNSKSSGWRVSQRRITVLFFGSLAVIGLVLFLAISYQFRENAFMWLYAYIVSSSFRLWTIVGWFVGIPIAVTMVELFTRRIRRTVRRKLFHFIAVVAFTPAAMIDPAFFAFAISTAVSLCTMVEVARHYGVYGSDAITRFVSHHIDERDSVKGAVRTHIYLIFGFGASLMLQYRHHRQELKRPVPAIMELSINIIPGIVSLGVVDSAAAIVGSLFLLPYRRALGRYLKNQLFTERANTSITHKTTTGTVGGLLSGLAFWALVLVVAEVPLVGPVLYSFTMVLVCSLTECFMDGVDNLQMPLVVLGAVNSLFAILLPIGELWANPSVCRPNPTTASSLAGALTSPWKNWPPVPETVKSFIS